MNQFKAWCSRKLSDAAGLVGVVSKKAGRRRWFTEGGITPAQGASGLRDTLNHLPLLQPSLTLLPRAFEISSALRVGVYDCVHVALAERERCELVTADDKLVKASASTSRSSCRWRPCRETADRNGVSQDARGSCRKN
jgi:predicted nucleic acid-binding protein